MISEVRGFILPKSYRGMSLSESTNDSIIILWVVICFTEIIGRPEFYDFIVICPCGQTSAMFYNICATYHVFEIVFEFNTKCCFGVS